MSLITQEMKLKDVMGNISITDDIFKDNDLDADSLFIRKGLTPADLIFKDDERAVISYITTAALDRDQEVILPQGAVLKDYNKHRVVMFGHDYSCLPIGKNMWIKRDEKGLLAKTVYAEHDQAEQVYQYRKGGFPLAVSIGFIPLKWSSKGDKDWDKVLGSWQDTQKDIMIVEVDPPAEGEPARIYTKWILLEYSDVAVPSNPEALQVAISKGIMAGDTEKATKYKCECIECGYKMESEKHCNDIKCPECGGQMRREERPGPGQRLVSDLADQYLLGDITAKQFQDRLEEMAMAKRKSEETINVDGTEVIGGWTEDESDIVAVLEDRINVLEQRLEHIAPLEGDAEDVPLEEDEESKVAREATERRIRQIQLLRAKIAETNAQLIVMQGGSA